MSRKAKPKFRVGQVVAVSDSESLNGTPWYGILQWEEDSMAEVSLANGDNREFPVGRLRNLTARERGKDRP